VTVAAAGSEEDEAEDRYVVVPANNLLALRAVGAGCGDAAVVRQAGDADVEKAAKEQAEEEGWKLEG
jgi:hypothetical protein